MIRDWSLFMMGKGTASNDFLQKKIFHAPPPPVLTLSPPAINNDQSKRQKNISQDGKYSRWSPQGSIVKPEIKQSVRQTVSGMWNTYYRCLRQCISLTKHTSVMWQGGDWSDLWHRDTSISKLTSKVVTNNSLQQHLKHGMVIESWHAKIGLIENITGAQIYTLRYKSLN